MRILLVHSGADLYGASRSVLRLATGLRGAGHEVLVLVPFEGPLLAALRQAGARAEVIAALPLITRKRFSSPGGLLSFARDARCCVRAMGAVLDAFRPDLVHTNNTTVLASYATELRRRGIPHVWHVRESFAEFGLLWPLLRRYILARADRVLCVSAAVAAQFGTHPAVVVLHNGFPRAEFDRVGPADAFAFRRAHGLEGRLCIGVSGRLKLKRKGQETFLRAAAQLVPRYPEARFLLIGSPFPGNEAHEVALRQLACELGLGDRVVFTGDAPDHLAALAALDVVVLSSGLPEPFGGVVVEAMALGRPVVGTAIGGTPEQIEDGVTGLLVPPNEPTAMAAALQRLLDDPALAARMGAAGRQRFLERFEFAPFFARLLEIYQTLATGRAPFTVLDTPCARTTFAGLREQLETHRRGGQGALAVDFTNVHIVTARRLEAAFRARTSGMDLFVPDSGVLCRALRLLGGGTTECLFGPHFMDRFLRDAPEGSTHSLLGGSAACVEQLRATYGGRARIVGARDGYFTAEEEDALAASIAAAAPDYLWVGLGTPKQQEWIRRHKSKFARTVLLAVGFAFDVNAGLKPDAPAWMHRAGLVWLHRLGQEPGRLGGRYLYYNALFVVLLAVQLVSRRMRPSATS